MASQAPLSEVLPNGVALNPGGMGGGPSGDRLLGRGVTQPGVTVFHLVWLIEVRGPAGSPSTSACLTSFHLGC